MAVTVSPSTEAMTAIVDRINSGEAYCLELKCEAAEQLIDVLDGLKEVRVDVIQEFEEQLDESLSIEDYSQHSLRIWIRKKVASLSLEELEPLQLLVRQIWQRINNYDTPDRRVMVWQVSVESQENPDKSALSDAGVFLASLLVRAEVKPS